MKRIAFPAKVLLFGEHTILRGSRALALPVWTHHSAWRYGGTSEQQAGLLALPAYLHRHFPAAFDYTSLDRDLAAGRYLASTIPTGYGLGSSGAVCVAVFEDYATVQGHQLLADMGAKAFFAAMEGFFHGTSSGTDPLIIYGNEAVELFPDGRYNRVRIPPLPTGWHFFLLDTRQPRRTEPLVAHFIQRYDGDSDFRQRTDTQWVVATHGAMDALLKGDSAALWAHFSDISAFQLHELPPMVLPSLHPIWMAGLAGNDYRLKICGAGGGGYCLGITCDWTATQAALSGWEVRRLGEERSTSHSNF